ncbi:MAG: MFS transporter [Anaerolineae bacterium]|nr:MFS transporter [Anaerolineae bacterium]
MTSPIFTRDRFTWLTYLMLGYYAYLLNVFGPLMPFLRAELGLSYTEGSLHFSAFAVGMLLAGAVGDRLARRLGTRRVFWGGAAGMALGTVGLAVGRALWLTVPSALVMGGFGTLLLVLIPATLSLRYGNLRTVALTESNTVASLCSSLPPVLVGLLESGGLGWRHALTLSVVFVALLAVQFRTVALPELRAVQTAETTRRRLPWGYWAYWTVLFLSVAVEFCLIAWSADFMEHEIGLGRVLAASSVSVFLGAMLVGRFVGSSLARRVPGLRLLLGAQVVTGLGFALFWLTRAAPLALVGLFIAGLGVANLYPVTLSLAVGAAPGQPSTATARATLASGVAILTLPMLLGWLADRLSLGAAYGVVGVLIVAAFLMTLGAASRVRP